MKKKTPLFRVINAACWLIASLLAVPATAQQPVTAAAGSPPKFDPATSRFVEVKTDRGVMVFELDFEHAPVTVENFLNYVDKRHYDGTIFHRVGKRDERNPLNIIQGGGYLPDLTEKPAGKPVANESGNGLRHVRGAVAMARRKSPDSATCQFFIDVTANDALDRQPPGHGHAIFGKVVAGMRVAEAINALEVKENPASHEISLPLQPPVIQSVRRLGPDEAKKLIDAAAAAESEPSSAPAAPVASAAAAMEYATISTDRGDIVVELDREKAPISVANFLMYVDNKFYDGTTFHRVVSNFMIQGGGFTEKGTPKAGEKPIANEWKNGLKNVKGSIAMARLSGKPDSATSQFFINVADNRRLDERQDDGAAYAVFGRVIAGMDVVDAIRVVKVRDNGHYEVSQPVEPVVIKSVRRLSAEEGRKVAADHDAKKPG